ncbi:MAG: class I SAM-dependent methyltransferase [Nitrospiria bacterium]
MSKPALIATVKNEIASKGPIPFARYMELALYHPEYGYYSSPGEKIGWQGDFYTSAAVHPVFGELLAKQLGQMAEHLDAHPFTIVEAGAGKGTLCRDILKTIDKEHPALFARLRYVIIEGSPWLKEKQKAWLAPLFPEQLSWADGFPKDFSGVVLSNELIDAFPVHRLRVEGDAIQEIHVDWKNDAFVEILKPPSTPDLKACLQRLDLSFDRPVELEINLRALHWIASVGQALLKGFVLTIDYGYPAAELYSIRRPKGTFLCYRKHRTNENPYEHVGEQDMTAHVDFTSFAEKGKTVGLATLGFTDQMHFLMGLGIAQRMEAPGSRMFESEEAKKDFLAMKQLMAPEGMGQTFKVLIQAKGLSAGIQLDGLQFKPFFQL